MLEIDVLNTFVAIAETGSFSKAAKRVFRTPSAISMQIKKLEDQLGRPMFKRDSRSVEITAEGELLLRYARRILALNNEVISELVASKVAGTVRLGATDDYGSRLLPVILRRSAQPNCCEERIRSRKSARRAQCAVPRGCGVAIT